jgi:hypothetical protein
MEISMEVPQKNQKIDLLYDPTIPHLGIYLKDCKSIYNTVNRYIREKPTCPCLLQFCSQEPNCGNSHGAQQPLNG